jgi:hypothetical protein
MNIDFSNLTLAIEHLKSARSHLGSELVATIQAAGIDAAPTVALASGMNGLSDVIAKLDSDLLREDLTVRLLDNNGVVLQERRPARSLGQALRWGDEMKEEFPGLSVEFSIEDNL